MDYPDIETRHHYSSLRCSLDGMREDARSAYEDYQRIKSDPSYKFTQEHKTELKNRLTEVDKLTEQLRKEVT